MNKVTIILAVYNVEQYLDKCIESILNQTFKEIEILAIDDGSTDKSADVIKKYLKENKNITYIKKENGGYGSVLEMAINSIKTKYFLICDPDDWLDINCIEKLYNAAEKNKVDLVAADVNYAYGNSIESEYKKCTHRNYPIKPNTIYHSIDNYVFFSPTPHAKLYKTKLAKNIIFPHNVSYTDTILYLVYLNRCSSLIYIDEALAFYYFDRPGNTASGIFGKEYKQKTFSAQIKVIESIIEQLKNSYCNNYVLYYRLYVEITSIIPKIKLIKDGSYNENLNKLFDVLDLLKEYKHEMVHEIKENNIFKLIERKFLIYSLYNKNMRRKSVWLLNKFY